MAVLKSIGIIIGSSRSPRIGPQVVDFVKKTIHDAIRTDSIAVSVVDLTDFKLPVYDEPAVPAMIPDPEKYTHEHSRQWAREIARHDGYVLVSPEYNFGMPGGVKNAIDYLYHVWKGKPIALITYGLDGGKTCSEQLENTFRRMGLKVATIRPQLAYSGGGSGPDIGPAMIEGALGSLSLHEWTKNSQDEIIEAFEEVQNLVLQV